METIANLGLAPPPGPPSFAPEPWFSGSVAFVDPLTPIVALTSGRKPTVPPTNEHPEILVRRFNGGTRFNDHGAWRPFIDVGPGNESHLAGLPDGKKGIHLLYKVRRSESTWQYITRRWNDKERRFGPIDSRERDRGSRSSPTSSRTPAADSTQPGSTRTRPCVTARRSLTAPGRRQ